MKQFHISAKYGMKLPMPLYVEEEKREVSDTSRGVQAWAAGRMCSLMPPWVLKGRREGEGTVERNSLDSRD